MKIDQLKVTNFRNIRRLEYQPISHLNIIIGKNGEGKTNLLEAIYMMSGNSSFRTNTDQDLINYDALYYIIRAKYNCLEKDYNIILNYNLNVSKEMKLNNKKVALSNDELLKVVLFTPDDLYLVKGSPQKRRYFLDFILKQLDAEYKLILDNYSKLLRKRNLLLKNDQTNSKNFTIVNDLFLENASKLILLRLNFITIYEEIAKEVFKEINNNLNNLKIRYALSFPVNSDKINLDILINSLAKQLQAKSTIEKRRRSTVAGPHLDDLHIYLDNRIARNFASQGQQRNIAITMKLAELYVFKKIMGFYPLFLLDEVLAELDNEKRQLLMDLLINADYQSFLTSVNIDKLNIGDAHLDSIVDGSLV
ncbi:MAG: DNA replication and repair protein RecF [Syntrophomonadaceae bacterium]|nr:DNA replication and repair protein RecF [Syntrophomonadaceae bacterium]